MTTAPTDAPPHGFWKIAEAYPDHLALVDPDERLVLRGRAARLVQPARARPAGDGARAGRRGRDAAAQRRRGVRAVPRGQPGRLLPHPDQLAPRRSRDRVHRRRTARRRRSSRTPASPSTRRPRPTRSTSPPTGRFAVGGDIAGLPRLRRAEGGPAHRRCPPTAPTGMVMNYTSGTTGRPRACAAALPGIEPEAGGRGFGGMLYHVRAAAVRRQRAHRRLAAVPHRGARVRGLGDPHRAHRRASWTSGRPQQMLHLIDTLQASRTPTWCRRSSCACSALPEDERAKYDVSSLRHMVHAAAPCPPDVKRQMIEWWGPVIDEYYAASEGGGTIVFADGVARAPGHRRTRVADLGDRDPRRRRQRAAAPARSAPSTCT